MIHLLFLVLFAEGAAALLLMVKVGPLQELAMRGVDQVKTGKGPATVKTLTCILKIQNKGLGTVSPMDQLLWRTQLLEASLIGAKVISADGMTAETSLAEGRSHLT